MESFEHGSVILPHKSVDLVQWQNNGQWIGGDFFVGDGGGSVGRDGASQEKRKEKKGRRRI